MRANTFNGRLVYLAPTKQLLLEDSQVKDTDIARDWPPLRSPNAACLPPRLLTVILEESTQYHERNLQTEFKIKGADITVVLTTSGFSINYRHLRLTIICS